MTTVPTIAAADFNLDSPELGNRLHSFVSELYPICSSITGNGLREIIRRIGQRIPLQIYEVPTGTQVFDWTVPREWNIRDAYVRNSRGEKIIDFKKSNLHIVNYSIPVNAKLPLQELKQHLHSLPERPDWIPYRTSYYRETWGFCLTQRQLDSLPEDEYEVVIDSSLEDGSLTYAECLVPGASKEEILISCHACHPSLCNDNLSALAVATFLVQALATAPRHFSYRFLFIPGTIGSITWLSRNENIVPLIRHGLVLACVGDSGVFSYKKSRRGNAEIDRAILHLLGTSGNPFNVRDFSPYGYDERQYCSPGFNLPVGCLNRTPHGKFPEYHTSADNLTFVTPEALASTLRFCLDVFHVLENNFTYLNLNPKCEPQLGRRGLYRLMGGLPDAGTRELAMLWTLNLSDGQHSLLDIAERSSLSFDAILQATKDLKQAELLALSTPTKPAPSSI
jgi:aminopeptidase-like protein